MNTNRRGSAFGLVFVLAALCCAQPVVLDDFEGPTWKWTTLVRSTVITKVGTSSGCWNNTVKSTSATMTNIPHDWTAKDHINFWMYSEVANGAIIRLILMSEATSAGSDYYSYAITLNWSGWRQFRIGFEMFSVSRSPVGWSKIDSVAFSSSWGTVPIPSTSVCFDDMLLFNQVASFPQEEIAYVLPPSETVQFSLMLRNPKAVPSPSFDITLSAIPSWLTITSSASLGGITLAGSALERIPVVVSVLSSATAGSTATVIVTAAPTSSPTEYGMMTITVTVKSKPTRTAKAHPFVFIDAAGIADLKAKAQMEPWSAAYLINVMTKWGPSAIARNVVVPTDLSYWLGYYLCSDGQSLSFNVESPYSHYCSSQDRYYTGQPYDGSWVGMQHNKNADTIELAAFAYAFTGNRTYADFAIALLVRYAKWYPSSPYHGTDGMATIGAGSGGRMQSETLAEAGWAHSAVWGYDLLYNAMTDAQRTMIEFNLLRPIVTTILRNNAGMSNWQAEHNMAIGIVGLLLDDSSYTDWAINSPTGGFVYHMKNSMLDDGMWYEGSLGYHFLSLNAYQVLAEAALRNGTDLYHLSVPMLTDPGKTKSIMGMYMAPLLVSMPGPQQDLTLPGLNDGGGSSLVGYRDNYEVAYLRYPEMENKFAWALCKLLATAKTRNSRMAFLLGKPLPSWCSSTGPVGIPGLGSMYIEESGLAVLRSTRNDYVLIDNGPHGGWHGHYDKLSMVLFTHDMVLIKDYGTVGYRLPQHANYFKRTLSHSALMVDGVCQPEASSAGTLLALGTDISSEVQVAAVLSPPLNAAGDVRGRRTVFMINPPAGEETWASEYPLVVDVLEGVQPSNGTHFYDEIFHSTGAFSLDAGGASMSAYTQSPGTDVAWDYITELKSLTTKSPAHASWTTQKEYSQHFESPGTWSNLVIDSSRFIDGSHSGRWDNTTTKTAVATSTMPTDWSSMARMSVWIYSRVANSAEITVVVNSPNATTTGIDYYSLWFRVDWTGWKQFNWTKSQFRRSGSPIGWHSIDNLSFSATWRGAAKPDTVLYLDCLELWTAAGSKLTPPPPTGLRISLPSTDYGKQFLVTEKAMSIPTYQVHPLMIVRKQVPDAGVHLLRSATGGVDFVTSFTATKSGDVHLATKDRDYSIANGGASCFVTTVSKAGAFERAAGYRCQSFTVPLHADASVVISGRPSPVDFHVSSRQSSVPFVSLTAVFSVPTTVSFRFRSLGSLSVTVSGSAASCTASQDGAWEIATCTFDAGSWPIDINTAGFNPSGAAQVRAAVCVTVVSFIASVLL